MPTVVVGNIIIPNPEEDWKDHDMRTRTCWSVLST